MTVMAINPIVPIRVPCGGWERKSWPPDCSSSDCAGRAEFAIGFPSDNLSHAGLDDVADDVDVLDFLDFKLVVLFCIADYPVIGVSEMMTSRPGRSRLLPYSLTASRISNSPAIDFCLDFRIKQKQLYGDSRLGALPVRTYRKMPGTYR